MKLKHTWETHKAIFVCPFIRPQCARHWCKKLRTSYLLEYLCITPLYLTPCPSTPPTGPSMPSTIFLPPSPKKTLQASVTKSPNSCVEKGFQQPGPMSHRNIWRPFLTAATVFYILNLSYIGRIWHTKASDVRPLFSQSGNSEKTH